LQSLVVGARSRRSLFINDAADRKTIVAVVIEAKEGRRVVAQQTIVHRNVSGRSGVSSTLGAVAPATRFTFASGNRREGNSRLLFVMNPGPVATDVDIQIAASGIPPTTITVEAQSVRTVNLNKLIPVGTRYAVIVQAAADFGGSGGTAAERGIVAEDFEGYRIETAARSVFGVSGGIGVVRPAAEWRFGRSRLTGGGTGQIVLYNPNEAGVTVDVAFVVGDELVRPEAVQGVELAGASSGVIRIDGLVDANAGMIVTATGPVYAERQLVDEETVTRAPGAPVRP
jgi:hypothetical protein